jgi:hypothetical protein
MGCAVALQKHAAVLRAEFSDGACELASCIFRSMLAYGPPIPVRTNPG